MVVRCLPWAKLLSAISPSLLEKGVTGIITVAPWRCSYFVAICSVSVSEVGGFVSPASLAASSPRYAG